ncbi:MAG: HxsD-like protein [Myxococcota bacterium]|nr:HxsD-like protein [Myxococcota bacterium]MDW8362291.1 HxsD-like protein [Myxococcales bacterium]
MSIELRFDKALYRRDAIEQAIAAFARHADCVLEDGGQVWRVRVEARRPERERAIAGELGNWALGATIRAGGVRS